MGEVNYIVHKMKMPDTGIGKSLGYEDDEDYRRAVEEYRKTLPPEVQEAIKKGERMAMNCILFGNPEGHVPPDVAAYYGRPTSEGHGTLTANDVTGPRGLPRYVNREDSDANTDHEGDGHGSDATGS